MSDNPDKNREEKLNHILRAFEKDMAEVSRQVDEICLILGMEIRDKESLSDQLNRIRERVRLKKTIFEKIDQLEEKIDDI